MTRNINMLYLLLSNTQNTLLVRLLDTYMMPEHKEHLNSLHVCVLYAAFIFRFSWNYDSKY